MRYEFEYEDEPGNWQRLGTAEGSGEWALPNALEDLAGDKPLDAGRYRYRSMEDETDRWVLFLLREDGTVQLDP